MPDVSPEAKAFVRAVGASADFPAFVGNVRAISSTAGDTEARVAALQDAIVQDVSLTAKIIRIANTAVNAPGAGGVTSVKQAILLLGFDRVRHLAMAATILDHMQKKAPGVSHLLTLSVLTANQSLHLAPRAGYPKGEVAYLCGLFRNLGEILVACYRTRQYNEWLALVELAPPLRPGSERKLLGFTFEEAGIALARRWKMPAEIVTSMRSAAPPGGSSAARLHAVTQLSAEVTNAVYRRTGQAKPGELSQVLAKFGRGLGLDAEIVMETAKSALVDSEDALNTMHATFDQKRLSQQIAVAVVTFMGDAAESADDHGTGQDHGVTEQRCPDDQVEPQAAPVQPLVAPMATPLAVSHPDWVADSGRYDANTTDSAVEARTRLALRALYEERKDGAFDAGRATRATLDAICGAGYRRALLALSSEDFSRVRGRVGAGAGHETAMNLFLVRVASVGGPLGVALVDRHELFVDMDSDEGKHMRRDRLLHDLDPKSFGLLPLVVEGKLIGCLYFDDPVSRVEATPALRELIRELRDHLVAALTNHRQRTAI